VEALLENLATAGATGIGQTSWGPTGFAFVPDCATAAQLMADVAGKAAGLKLDIRLCKGLNRGAMIEENARASA
jgi:predicted sugar kinase